MKSRGYIKGLIILTMTVATLAVQGQSMVYERYAPREELTVAYFKGLLIDSVTRVDVTVVRANDSITWEGLIREFNLSDYMIERHRAALKKDHHALGGYCSLKGHPEQRLAFEEGESDFVIYSFENRAFYIYSTPTKEQMNRVFRQRIDKAGL